MPVRADSLPVVTTFAWLVAALLLVLALAAAVATRVPGLVRPVRVGVVAAEALVGLVVLVDLGLVLRADAAERPDSLLTHVGYAVAAAGLVPLLVWRTPSPDDGEPELDPEPASLWVVAVTLLAVAVCVVRLAQTR